MEEIINAHNLLHDYIEIHRYIRFHLEEKYDTLPWDVQIRVRRVFALLVAYKSYAKSETEVSEADSVAEPDQKVISKYNAYDNDKRLGLVKGFFTFDGYSMSPMTEEGIEKVQAMVKEVIMDPRSTKAALSSSKGLRDTGCQEIQLQMLMKVRLKSAELRYSLSGYLGGICCVLPYDMVKTLYFDHITEADKKIDELIVTIMGPVFQLAFTKEYLVKNFGYPTQTDDELFDYYVDNL